MSLASQDDTGEVGVESTSQNALTLKNSLVNPALGIQTSGFATAGSYVLNYSTNPGVVQLYGNYQLSGSTLTLDYANELYASTATTPVDMSGHGHTATATVAVDSNVVSQLVTLTNTCGTNWQVTAS